MRWEGDAEEKVTRGAGPEETSVRASSSARGLVPLQVPVAFFCLFWESFSSVSLCKLCGHERGPSG